ncbi:MAG: hypothetical protein IPJ19_21165 [Planctomycetes bacterium]|nr:hypothetical protein [Planctomycetota bacterium]
MTKQRLLLVVPTVLLLACSTVSCRGIQIHETEKRVDKLEARVAALEAQVQMLQKK